MPSSGPSVSVAPTPPHRRTTHCPRCGLAATQKARVGLETEWGHPSQGGSNNGLHTIGHPNPLLAMFAPHFPALVDIHAQVLRSEPRHLRLNGQNMKRADPTDAAGAYGEGLPQAKNWHVVRP